MTMMNASIKSNLRRRKQQIQLSLPHISSLIQKLTMRVGKKQTNTMRRFHLPNCVFHNDQLTSEKVQRNDCNFTIIWNSWFNSVQPFKGKCNDIWRKPITMRDQYAAYVMNFMIKIYVCLFNTIILFPKTVIFTFKNNTLNIIQKSRRRTFDFIFFHLQ